MSPAAEYRRLRAMGWVLFIRTGDWIHASAVSSRIMKQPPELIRRLRREWQQWERRYPHLRNCRPYYALTKGS